MEKNNENNAEIIEVNDSADNSADNSASTTKEVVAAVDLGSNSFHMIVTQHFNGEVKVIDRVREMVRLGGGLDKKNRLTKVAMDRAIAALERFRERLTGIPTNAIRVVGTKTLRTARNAEEFLKLAEAALEHEIEVISGYEEARLVYQGVTHAIEVMSQKLLVMDIGGRSTELIIGEGQTPFQMDSLTMGSVSMSQKHFADGSISKKQMEAAELSARAELRGIYKQYRSSRWELAIGSSGTIRAIAKIILSEGWSHNSITFESLKKLRKAVINAGSIDNLNFDGLKDERKPVFPGGLAILYSTFKSLNIEEMLISDGALREGLIYDQVGRITNHDIRELAIDKLMQRYHADPQQAERIHVLSSALFNQVVDHFDIDEERFENALRWAAKLHELGLAISHRKYHQHSAYLIMNSDIPGFSRQEQRTVSTIVMAHRMKLKSKLFDNFQMGETMIKLTIILRISVILLRGRSSNPIPLPKISFNHDGNGDDQIEIIFEEEWLQQHALTQYDLNAEAAQLKNIGFKLHYSANL